MTTETEALRAQFKELLSDSRRACFYEGDSQYAYPHDFSWFFYQAGYAAAKAETANVVAKERKRCAAVCDRYASALDYSDNAYVRSRECQQAADAIRAGAKEPSDG